MGALRLLAVSIVTLTACGDNFHPGGGTLMVSPQIGLHTDESGTTTTFTVSLTNQPMGEVIAELTSMDLTEGTVFPRTLVFDGTNFHVPQRVTVMGVDDDRADGDRSFTVRVATETLGDVDLEVINGDDDFAGVAVTPLVGLMTSEAGLTATFTVALTSKPAADVTMPVTPSDASEGSADKSSLTFTSDNWKAPQVVTITGVQDAVTDGSVDYSVVVGATMSGDPDYHAIDPDDVRLVNIDDDVGGIVVSPVAGLQTSEAGAVDNFSVVLQTQPTGNVTIPVSSAQSGEATASTAQLTFTTANWNTPQPVTVTGVNDFVDDGDKPFTIVLGAATSSDSVYSGIDPNDVTGLNADNDTAGIVVAPTGGLTTSEAGTGDAFTVVLQSQPTSAVTIAVTSSDVTEGTTTQTQLIFMPGTWNQAQTVNVTGVDDLISDGNINYTVVLAAAVSADAGYTGRDAPDVMVTNIDNDIAGVTIEPLTGVLVSEFLDTDTFTIVLNTVPLANVTISLASSDLTEGTVSPTSVTFTPLNWNVPQTVTVTGVNDNLADGNIIFSIITGAATSTDPAYSTLNPPDVEVTNIDNDIAQVFVKARRRLLVSESGQTATFRVRLTLAPTATVTCTLQSSDLGEAAVSPTTLVFQPNQFGFQTVTVTGVNDTIVDGDQLLTIVLNACTSTDPQYSGSNPRDVTVINRDND